MAERWPNNLSDEEFDALIARIEANNPLLDRALADIFSLDQREVSTEEAAELEVVVSG